MLLDRPSTSPALARSQVLDPMSAPTLRWGILGPGKIANTFALAVHEGTTSSVVAVGSRSPSRAADFASRHGIERAHGSYKALVRDDGVDVIYIATPHSAHLEHALLAIRAGRPVLVEKSFARSLRETDDILEAAESAGLLAAEAMWSRFLPHYDVIRRTVDAGTLGSLALVHADHSQLLWPDGPQRLADPALAGGSLLDLGVYPISFADHVLGALSDVQAQGALSTLGVDLTSAVSGRGSGNALARLTCTMTAASACVASVVGIAARIEVDGPFFTAGKTVRLIAPDRTLLDEVVAEDPQHGFRYQAAEVARALAADRRETWSMPWAATRRVMTVMDEVRRQLGVVYPGE